MKFSFGNFYGEVQKRAEVSGIGLTETVYPAHARLPLHAHESPYFCLVLKGAYEEIDAWRQRLCRPATLVFHPAGEAHANQFGKDGAACFNLEFGAEWTKRVSAVTPALDAPAPFTGAATAGLAARLRREFHLPISMDTPSIADKLGWRGNRDRMRIEGIVPSMSIRFSLVLYCPRSKALAP